MEAVEIRSMVVDLAASIASRCVDATRKAGLANGQMTDHITVEGMEWRIDATYHSEQDTILIDGHIHQSSAQVLTSIGDLLSMLGGTNGQHGQFTFHLPASWLPTPE